MVDWPETVSSTPISLPHANTDSLGPREPQGLIDHEIIHQWFSTKYSLSAKHHLGAFRNMVVTKTGKSYGFLVPRVRMWNFCNARSSPTRGKIILPQTAVAPYWKLSPTSSFYLCEEMGVPENWQDFPRVKLHYDSERFTTRFFQLSFKGSFCYTTFLPINID